MAGTLMRSRVDRKIAGVCGGIARNQGWDSNVVRLIWVAHGRGCSRRPLGIGHIRCAMQ